MRSDSSGTANADYLRNRFVAHLPSTTSGTVLDVGCGEGKVMELLRDRGFAVTGVEQDAATGAHARYQKFEVHDASAEQLPFKDQSFDYVTMRHVPHHLANPGAGVAEAVRVARRGALIAEPWFDVSLPGQALALEFDQWLKSQHRRVGRIHKDNHSAEQLLDMVPDLQRFDVQIEYCLRLRPRPLAEFTNEAMAATKDLNQQDQVRQPGLLARIGTKGASYNGSVILVLERTNSLSRNAPLES